MEFSISITIGGPISTRRFSELVIDIMTRAEESDPEKLIDF